MCSRKRPTSQGVEQEALNSIINLTYKGLLQIVIYAVILLRLRFG